MFSRVFQYARTTALIGWISVYVTYYAISEEFFVSL